MRTLNTAGLILIIAILAAGLAGCGGSGDDVVTPPVTPPVTPTVHAGGNSVYLIGTQNYSASSYIPPTGPDSFTVAPGVYRPVVIKQADLGTMMIPAGGAENWPGTIVGAGSTLTPSGWVLAPGIYAGTIPNPAGGDIAFAIRVVAPVLDDGFKVRMVAGDLKDYPNYQAPTGTPFPWVQIWTKDGQVVVKPMRYNASVENVSGSEYLEYVDNELVGKTVGGVVTYLVKVYDNTPIQDGGGGTVTVDVVTVEFTAPPLVIGQ